jgi:hypothetical protein
VPLYAAHFSFGVHPVLSAQSATAKRAKQAIRVMFMKLGHPLFKSYHPQSQTCHPQNGTGRRLCNQRVSTKLREVNNPN